MTPGHRNSGKEGAVSEDSALGGALKLAQPTRGHRFGHDAILLAAAANLPHGGRAVDLGAGVGAAGLALATRRKDISVTLVEIDGALAALAAQNAERNGLADRVDVVVLDVVALTRNDLANGLAPGAADAVLMNPPFNDPSRLQVSPQGGRRLAHAAAPETLSVWIKAAGRLLRPGGGLTLIWRADGLGEVLHALAPGFGGIAVLPVHSKPGAPAIRVLIGARKASQTPLRVLPALLLNDVDGRESEATAAVLRGGGLSLGRE